MNKLGFVAHACNPALKRWSQNDQKVKTTLGYIAEVRLEYMYPVVEKKSQGEVSLSLESQDTHQNLNKLESQT